MNIPNRKKPYTKYRKTYSPGSKQLTPEKVIKENTFLVSIKQVTA